MADPLQIVIADTPEPLTEASENTTPILAESRAYRMLKRDLERYALGELRGRSYLISGHRGSGKTTLILKAIQEVRNRSRGESHGHAG